jgi:hypothetical protein
MLPLLPAELGDDFDLDRVLRWGSVAVVLQSEEPAESLRACVQMYLKQEIQAEALVRNLPGFARFLPVAALFHGQVLNTAGLARDAGVARTTVTGWMRSRCATSWTNSSRGRSEARAEDGGLARWAAPPRPRGAQKLQAVLPRPRDRAALRPFDRLRVAPSNVEGRLAN